MKKLFLFLFILVLYSQCEKPNPKTCGIVTEKAAFSPDSKSDAQSVSVSYNPCEYILIVPENKDTIALNDYVEAKKFVLINKSPINPRIRVYRLRPRGSDTTSPPRNPLPPPPIRGFENVMIFDSQRKLTTLYNVLTQPFLQNNVNK